MSEEPKRCEKCGAPVAEGQRVCGACGQTAQPENSPLGPSTGDRARTIYAGFWLRLLAYAVDTFLLGVVAALAIIEPMVARGVISLDNPMAFIEGSSRQITAAKLLITLITWLYFASCESSVWQATLGKKLFGLRVTDLNGARLSFARASGRYFGKLLSGSIFLLGFVMAAFTQKKQALHDLLAGCLVIRQR